MSTNHLEVQPRGPEAPMEQCSEYREMSTNYLEIQPRGPEALMEQCPQYREISTIHLEIQSGPEAPTEHCP